MTALAAIISLQTDRQGKSPDTIYRMAQKRQIPTLMFGGSRCFDPSVLAHWLIKNDPQLAIAARYFQKAA
ncbi:MAG: hypothetical protein WA354_01940 [Terracidiphilus sp.]